MYSLSHIIHIPTIQASHADTAVLRHVDVRVGAEPQDLRFAQAREAEHADLVCDVAPAAFLAIQFFQFASQRGAHVLDAAAHGA